MERFIPYGKHTIDQDDIDNVIEALKSDYITQGPRIEELERKLADYCGAKYCIVVNSGTSALHCAYYAIGLTSGDEFITSPISFVATSNAGLFLNAKPLFADVEEETGNIDIKLIEAQITKQTKLIVPVHYAGHPANMAEIYRIAKRNNLFIIEDACHALGAEYNGKKIGSCEFSDAAVLSFHPVKHITTGEGGAIVTNNEKLYKKMRMFRTHGITKINFHNEAEGPWYYEMQLLGYNYRLTDIQSALGISQLNKLNRFIKSRRSIAHKYNQIFHGNPFFEIPIEKPYASSSFHLYPIRLKDPMCRRNVFIKLREMNIGVQVHYIPIYLQPYYQALGYRKELYPKSQIFYAKEISIPIFPTLTDEEIEYITEKILTTVKQESI